MTALKLKKVFEDAEEDLKDSEFTGIFGKVLNPLTDMVILPVAEKATEIVPAVAGAIPLPFVDEVSSAVVGVGFGAAKLGYHIFPYSADADVAKEADGLFGNDMIKNYKNKPQEPKPLLSSAMSAIGFASNSVIDIVRLPFSGDLGKWMTTSKMFFGYMATSGVGGEVMDAFASPGALSAIMIIAKIQAGRNDGKNSRRNRAAMASLPTGIADKADFKEIIFDAMIYGKYSSAAYGISMIDSSELLQVNGHKLNVPLAANVSTNKRKRKMSRFLGVPAEDIIDPSSQGGDIDIVGHFMAIDRRKSAIVLALRGTYTLSGLKTDAAAYSRPFCNGVAHAGIADRTDKIWEHLKVKIVDLLKANPGFNFVVTGHSLGAGVAVLLALKIKHEQALAKLDPALASVKVSCFGFASPPVYLADPENEAVMAEAMKDTYAFIHENDVVPFCSFDSLRRMSHTIDDIDDATNMIVGPLMAIGKLPIGPLMRRKVFKDLDLEPAANAEKLAIPAPYAIWMQKQSENEGGDPVYDAMFCRPEAKNGDKGTNDLHVLFDDRMIADHMNPEYERALASIATQMKGVHGIDGYTFPPRCVR